MNGPDQPSRAQPLTATSAESIETMAADWFVRRDAGLSATEERELQRWLAADSRHASAMTELEKAWALLNEPRRAGRGDAIRRTLALRGQRTIRGLRLCGWTTAGLAAAAALVFAFLPRPTAPTEPVPRATTAAVVLRPDRQDLPDGSWVELNAGAEIAVEFSAARRGVRLVRGEALFSVAKDPARPFVVSAGPIEVRAVGTAFTVSEEADQVAVLVTEGRVAVQHQEEASAAPAPLYLSAGYRVDWPDAQPDAPAPAPVGESALAEALAWRRQRVEFTDAPLAEAVAVFNRDNRAKLQIVDQATAALRITGIFWTNDPEGFVRLLESSVGVRATRGQPDRIMLRK